MLQLVIDVRRPTKCRIGQPSMTSCLVKLAQASVFLVTIHLGDGAWVVPKQMTRHVAVKTLYLSCASVKATSKRRPQHTPLLAILKLTHS